MAGYAYGFADGGDVQDEDNSGALPVAAPEQDNSGALPVTDDQPESDRERIEKRGVLPTDHEGGMAPFRAAGDAGKRILGYLMGADAAPPAANDKMVAGVKAEYPGVSDATAHLLAVHKARELGGDDAAWQMIQFNRMAYNAKQSFAKAAMEGTPQKPADPQAAAQAATQASAHVLDGSDAKFTASPDGFITATVTMPGTSQPQSYNLTPEQFAQFTDVGKGGQWDRVMETGGVPATLQRIVGNPANGMVGAHGEQTTNSQQPQQPQQEKKPLSETYEDDDTDFEQPAIHRVGTKNGSNFGKTPSTLDLSDGEDVDYAADDSLQGRANRLFPSASQSNQRNAYIAQQMDQAAQGRRALRQSEAKGAFDVAKATIAGGSRERAAELHKEGQEGAAGIRTAGSERNTDKRVALGREVNNTRQQALLENIKQKYEREQNINVRNQLARDYSLVNSPNFPSLPEDTQREIERRVGLPVAAQSSLFGGETKPAIPAGQPTAYQQATQKQQPQQSQAPATPQAPTPQGKTPQAPMANGTGSPGPGKKFFNGHWYTREEYKQAFGK